MGELSSGAEPADWSNIGPKQRITHQWSDTARGEKRFPVRDVLTNHRAQGPAAGQSLTLAPRVFWLMSWSFVVFSLLRFVVGWTRRASEVLRLNLLDVELRYAHASNKCHAHPAGEERIFSVGLLAAPPARIAKNVDVGRPKGKTEEHFMLVIPDGLVVLGTCLGGDCRAHGVNKVGVPSGGHSDHLRKICRVASKCNAVQTFVPPVVLGNTQPRDRRRMVAHLRNLLF